MILARTIKTGGALGSDHSWIRMDHRAGAEQWKKIVLARNTNGPRKGGPAAKDDGKGHFPLKLGRGRAETASFQETANSQQIGGKLCFRPSPTGTPKRKEKYRRGINPRAKVTAELVCVCQIPQKQKRRGEKADRHSTGALRERGWSETSTRCCDAKTVS